MAFLDEARKAGRVKYRIARFEFASGQTRVYATAPVISGGVYAEPRLVGVGRARNRISEALGGMTERASLTLELDDHDGALSPLFVGTQSGDARNEYTGDGFLNGTAQVFAGFIADDGTAFESPLTPPLVACGGPTRGEDGRISIAFASQEDRLLGRPSVVVRLEHLGSSEFLAPGGTARVGVRSSVTAGPDAVEWNAIALRLTEIDNVDEVVPYCYGPRPIRGIETGDRDGMVRLLFVSFSEPDLSDVGEWSSSLYEEDGPGRSLVGLLVKSAQVRVVAEDGDSHDLWVVYSTLSYVRSNYTGWKLWLFPGSGARLSGGIGGPQTPVRVIRNAVVDHSPAGVDAIDSASFDAVEAALPVVGVAGIQIAGEGTLGEIVATAAAPWPLALWVGLDGKLHASISGVITAAEREAIAAGPLLSLGPEDVFGEFEEVVPYGAGQRGAPVSDLYLEWTDEASEIYGADALVRRMPGVASIPLAERLEYNVRADTLIPARARDALASLGLRALTPLRRFSFASHDWLTAIERGTLLRLSTPARLGAGLGDGEGYTDRLCRLEGTEDSENTEHALVYLEDLGPIENLREAVFGDVAEWVYDAVPAEADLALTAGSDVVTVNQLGLTSGVVGCDLVVPGGTPANRARAYRVVALVDAFRFRIEAPVVDTQVVRGEVLPTNPDFLRLPWVLLHTQASRPTNASELTACDESTGAFRSGELGFTVRAG